MLKAIAAHPRANDLARFTRDCLLDSAPNLPDAPTVLERAAARGLSPDDAVVESTRVTDALVAPSRVEDSILLGTLLAYGLALDAVDTATQTQTRKLVQLATHAGIDAWSSLDATMGEAAVSYWSALAALLQDHGEGKGTMSRAEAIVAASAIMISDNPTAQNLRKNLASLRQIPLFERLLATTPTNTDAALSGELAPVPRGPVATFFLGMIGWLLISHVVRLIGRFALQLRRPAELTITTTGIHVRSTTQLLGKVLRESETRIPWEGLVRATREVRYPRLGTYAGLTALALGSYIGVGWFIDGIRAQSLSLATMGLLVVVLGVALDFVLVSLLPGRKGKCRLVLVPRKGAATCVGWVDATKADALLRQLDRGQP
jgi:hypothetical protein